ncbi:GNAT family N-acetyltransferase [Lactobacillus taiwanensis]|uniref:GNAT family N-acetyltransferase n=1 Tax=Lactobacillus taiwanensis TaxID=508451 RepID=UPI00241F2B08|nr:GNAT family N-acetyltransferase [Lactobacillus taiwanensis]
MIRKAKLTDFPLVYPILKQIFDEMDMDTIKALPESQFYDLMKHGFYSSHYRYSHNRMWVETDEMDRPIGLIVMYGYDDQNLIDISLKSAYPKVGLPLDTIVFSDKEALPHEWYLDAIAVSPKHWGEGIAQKLIKLAPEIAKQNGYKKVSLNVDQDNPRAARLYDYIGFKTTSTMTIGDRIYDHMIKKVG